MAQVNFDWLVGWFDQPADPLYSINPADGQVSTIVYMLVDQDQLESKEDTLRVERIVGQVNFLVVPSTTFPTTQIWCAERIFVGEMDDTFEPPEPTSQNLFSSEGFDRSFLWERRTVLPGPSSYGLCDPTATPCTQKLLDPVRHQTMWPHNDPWWSVIDCRVKRRLKDREVLCYQISVSDYQGASPTGDPEDYPTLIPRLFLRVGVKF